MIEVAAAAVSLLAPYLKKVAGGMADKAGDQAWAALGSLLRVIRDKFHRDADPASERALSAFESDPDDSVSAMALKGAIYEKVSADRGFADALRSAVEVAQGTTQTAGSGSLQQSISIGGSNYGSIEQTGTRSGS